MIGLLKDWVINIVTLVMLIVFLELLVPSGKTKKFVNLVSGFILIIAIISPLLGVFKSGVDLKEFQLADKLTLSQMELEASKNTYSDSQLAQITSTYKRRLVEDIEQSVSTVKGVGSVKAEIMVEEDSKSIEFGKIKRVLISVSEKNDKEITPVLAIETIKIGKDNKSNDSPNLNEKQSLNNVLSAEIKNKISKAFQVSEDIIAIVPSND